MSPPARPPIRPPQAIWGSAHGDAEEPRNNLAWMGQQRVSPKKGVLHQKVLLGRDGCHSVHPEAAWSLGELLHPLLSCRGWGQIWGCHVILGLAG